MTRRRRRLLVVGAVLLSACGVICAGYYSVALVPTCSAARAGTSADSGTPAAAASGPVVDVLTSAGLVRGGVDHAAAVRSLVDKLPADTHARTPAVRPGGLRPVLGRHRPPRVRPAERRPGPRPHGGHVHEGGSRLHRGHGAPGRRLHGPQHRLHPSEGHERGRADRPPRAPRVGVAARRRRLDRRAARAARDRRQQPPGRRRADERGEVGPGAGDVATAGSRLRLLVRHPIRVRAAHVRAHDRRRRPRRDRPHPRRCSSPAAG